MIDGSEKRNRQLAFELQNLHVCEKHGNIMVVAVTCQTTEKVFHRRRNKRDSQRPQTLKNALNFLVEFKPLFHESLKDHESILRAKDQSYYGQTCMLQLIFIKPSDRISLESFDVTKSTCCCLYPGGGLPYERGGDARRLAQRCKFRILVSLRVF